MIAIAHEQDKFVWIYDLDEFLTLSEDKMAIEPKFKFKNWKKISAITDVSVSIQGKDINGLVIGDKVGEIYFLNVDNFEKLPKDENTESDVAKLLYGHQ